MFRITLRGSIRIKKKYRSKAAKSSGERVYAMTLGVESGQNIDCKDFRSQNIENKELGRRRWASRQPLAVLNRITPICGGRKVGCHSRLWKESAVAMVLWKAKSVWVCGNPPL